MVKTKNYWNKIKYWILISLIPLLIYSQEGKTQTSNEQNNKKGNWELNIAFGSSSNNKNPFNGSFGVYYGDLQLYDNLNLKVLLGDFTFEKTSSSIKHGIGLEKKLKDYSLELDAGFSQIRFYEPLHVSESEVSEPFPEFALFTDLILKRKISEKVNCFLKFSKNMSTKEVHGKGNYPKYRISLGLDYFAKE